MVATKFETQSERLSFVCKGTEKKGYTQIKVHLSTMFLGVCKHLHTRAIIYPRARHTRLVGMYHPRPQYGISGHLWRLLLLLP